MALRIVTQWVLGVRCPNCGIPHSRAFSLFGLPPELRHTCECGSPLFTLRLRRRGAWRLQLPCPSCREPHLLGLPRQPLLRGEMIELDCPADGRRIAFLGTGDRVRAAIRAEVELEPSNGWTAEEEAYFLNPGVMYEALDWLHALIEREGLSCPCGSPEVGIDVLPGAIELHCGRCGRSESLSAETEEDLLALLDRRRLPLQGEGRRLRRQRPAPQKRGK